MVQSLTLIWHLAFTYQVVSCEMQQIEKITDNIKALHFKAQ